MLRRQGYRRYCLRTLPFCELCAFRGKMFFVGIASCRDELYVMLLWLRQECRSLLRLALPVLVVCSVGGVGMTGMPYLPNLCASVPICGRHISARRFCVFRVFCGNTLSVCLVGALETSAPPASSSHGTHSCLGCSPTDFTDLHRCWCLSGGALVSSAPPEQ